MGLKGRGRRPGETPHGLAPGKRGSASPPHARGGSEDPNHSTSKNTGDNFFFKENTSLNSEETRGQGAPRGEQGREAASVPRARVSAGQPRLSTPQPRGQCVAPTGGGGLTGAPRPWGLGPQRAAPWGRGELEIY